MSDYKVINEILIEIRKQFTNMHHDMVHPAQLHLYNEYMSIFVEYFDHKNNKRINPFIEIRDYDDQNAYDHMCHKRYDLADPDCLDEVNKEIQRIIRKRTWGSNGVEYNENPRKYRRTFP